MTATFTTQIEVDANAVAWVGGTQVKVVEIVLDKIANGWSPEEIHFQHPNLSLAQIYAALTYYYENQQLLDTQIAQRAEEAERMAQHSSDPAFRQQLRHSKQTQ